MLCLAFSRINGRHFEKGTTELHFFEPGVFCKSGWVARQKNVGLPVRRGIERWPASRVCGVWFEGRAFGLDFGLFGLADWGREKTGIHLDLSPCGGLRRLRG
jgi:hypothetical protein